MDRLAIKAKRYLYMGSEKTCPPRRNPRTSTPNTDPSNDASSNPPQRLNFSKSITSDISSRASCITSLNTNLRGNDDTILHDLPGKTILGAIVVEDQGIPLSSALGAGEVSADIKCISGAAMSALHVSEAERTILRVGGAANDSGTEDVRDEDLEGWRVGSDDGRFELHARDDDDFAQRPGEVGELLELQEDQKTENGNDDDDGSDADDADQLQALAESGLESPERLDGKDNDANIGADALVCMLGWLGVGVGKKSTYQCCRHESKDLVIKTLGTGVIRLVEKGIKGCTLQAVEQPLNQSENNVQANGAVDKLAEGLGCKSKVKEQEGHLNDEVHPNVIDLFSEESLWLCR
ncbi:hypothetical protein BP6252_10144 [Coleophoma cylindrospora]|uniref:Uncharacterized protein n=1 Tax=Coleophoma cylindrospora TaxID=1849047 RepID=A0A3D8QXK6_9HELO|nr:hypothetical protein BP6252_10144 [Coleophoma cylindrospora]